MATRSRPSLLEPLSPKRNGNRCLPKPKSRPSPVCCSARFHASPRWRCHRSHCSPHGSPWLIATTGPTPRCPTSCQPRSAISRASACIRSCRKAMQPPGSTPSLSSGPVATSTCGSPAENVLWPTTSSVNQASTWSPPPTTAAVTYPILPKWSITPGSSRYTTPSTPGFSGN